MYSFPVPLRRHMMRVSFMACLSLIAACEMPEGAGPSAPAIDALSYESPPVISVEPAPIDPARTKSRAPSPRRGVVTAGDIDDGLNLAAFTRYQRSAANKLGLPRAGLGRPVSLQLIGPGGVPAAGTRVTMRKPGAAQPFYDGYAGVNGMVTVFPAVHGAGNLSTVEMRAIEGGNKITHRVKTGGPREVIRVTEAPGWAPEFLDLAIVLDTTGSMGDELAWLTKELQGIVRKARSSMPGINVRYALVAYRDHGDEYVVRNFGFTSSAHQMTRWLKSLNASGGGDYPEAAAQALHNGAALNWRRGKGERLMFHIADAPPHTKDARSYLAAARSAAGKNVQIFGLGASGVAEESELLMRQAAVQTGGRYLFLTDDSGIGNSHAEPTISCYRVTKLRDLMVRILRSELTGKRIEAGPAQVIRTVGSYDNGICRN